MKEETRTVKSWNELVDFIEDINPYEETLVLSGWVNNMVVGRLFIKDLVFTTKPVEIITVKPRRKKKK